MSSVSEKKLPYLALASGMAVFALVMFRVLLAPGALLVCSDTNVGVNVVKKAMLPRALAGCWYDNRLAGIGDYLPASFTNLLLALLPPAFFTNWIYVFYLTAAALLLVVFLRRAGLNWAACIMGALTAFWLSSNCTLVFAGHLGKFAVLFFAALLLYLLERTVHSGKFYSGMPLAGGAMGMMMVEQADTGLFFALALGLYVLFVLLVRCRLRGRALAGALALLLLPAFLVALRPAWEGYRVNVRDAALAAADDPAAQWEFVTQWSWPPEESIDFIAPGYTGWRTGEPAGPYWGRMGRSAGWESTGQGFPNFKLENVYLGAIPLALALYALWAAWKVRRTGACQWQHAGAAAEVWFWGALAVMALLLAFGKHFPLYRLFYQLPVVGNIRNPNKFLQIFQLAVAILAAYGLDATAFLSKKRLEQVGLRPPCDAAVSTMLKVPSYVEGLRAGPSGSGQANKEAPGRRLPAALCLAQAGRKSQVKVERKNGSA